MRYFQIIGYSVDFLLAAYSVFRFYFLALLDFKLKYRFCFFFNSGIGGAKKNDECFIFKSDKIFYSYILYDIYFRNYFEFSGYGFGGQCRKKTL